MKKTKQKMTDKIRLLIAGFAGQEFRKAQIMESISGLKRVNLDSFFTKLITTSIVAGVKRDGMIYYRQSGDIFQKNPRRKVHSVTRSFERVRDCINGFAGQSFTVAQVARETGLISSVVARFCLLCVKRKQLLRFGRSGRYQYIAAKSQLVAGREPRGAVSEIVFEIMVKHPDGLSYEDVLCKAKNFCQRELNRNTVQCIILRWHSCGYVKRISFGVYALRSHVRTRPPTKIGPKVIM